MLKNKFDDKANEGVAGAVAEPHDYAYHVHIDKPSTGKEIAQGEVPRYYIEFFDNAKAVRKALHRHGRYVLLDDVEQLQYTLTCYLKGGNQ